jgi:tripartite-type tricarboxylate transporter receptor subunit TctC
MFSMQVIRWSGYVLVVCAGLLAFPVYPQAYPSKPVRVVIAWPPSGLNDVAARLVLPKLSERLGQQFVLENRGGASGVIGAEVVSRAPPDGYTLLVHSSAHVVNPWTHKKLPYATLDDFVGVATLITQVGALVVHPSLPVKTTRELIALAKSRPGQITYASAGEGSAPHLWMALLTSMSGAPLLHVPYKGAGPALTALMSGETHAAILGLAVVAPQVAAKRLRALAVTSATRSNVAPDLPTIAESGVPGYELTSWVGVLAPTGTPRAIVEKLNAEINATLKEPAVVQTLARQECEPLVMSTEEFRQRMHADYKKYAALIKLAGLSAK